MERHTLHEYVWFGTCVRYLQSAREREPIHDTSAAQGYILTNLEQFFQHLRDLQLNVTWRASGELMKIRDQLKATELDAELTREQASELRRSVRELRMTLEAELQGHEAYVLTPKRLNVEFLMERVDLLFAPGVYARLPVVARADLAEAGKCIAVERATAAAFHILRGTEAVLRAFYRALIRRNRLHNAAWAALVSDLRSRSVGHKFEVVLNHLDHIRVAFRNPTAHPEKMYDIQEAQDLWSICADSINRMAAELPEVSPA